MASSQQTYKFGWFVAAGYLVGATNPAIFDYWGTVLGTWGVVVAILMLGWHLASGIAAAAVRPWSWYVLLASSPLALVSSGLFVILIAPDWTSRAIVGAVSLTSCAGSFVYFYKRRAFFGASWRWHSVERWCPRVVGPATRSPDTVPGIAGLSHRRRWLFVAVVVVLAIAFRLSDALKEQAQLPIPELPLVGFSEPTGQPPLVVPRAVGSSEHAEIIITDDKNTFYFNNVPGRCYAYEIPDQWGWGSEKGLLRSIVGPEMVGVVLLSETDLKGVSGPSLIARGAKNITEGYERTIGQRLSPELLPIEIPRFKAVRWRVSWVTDQTRKIHADAEKVFLEMGPGWIAQVSIFAEDSERLFRRLTETLSTTGHPDCYWPYLQRRYPDLFPEAATRS